MGITEKILLVLFAVFALLAVLRLFAAPLKLAGKLPVVPSTEHSIGREQFSWMKPTASFINCARGALIKENELVECLKDGTLFQAGLDVFEHEPIQESSRELFNLDNVIMTPHMAATTEQSVLNCCTSVANDIVAVCNGQEPKVKAQKPKF